MRLGATIYKYGQFEDPETYVAECQRCGYRAAVCPKDFVDDIEKRRAMKRGFQKVDIVIAEVGAWVNALDPRPEERARNLNTIAGSLAIADELEARCCVTVAGSLAGENGIGIELHQDNFSPGTFDAVVQWVRKILGEVKPTHTKLALEMSPWTLLDGPEIYRKLIDAVDHPALAVHLDPVNAVNSPHLYYSSTELLNRCFDLLGDLIVSCHAKDILQAPDPQSVLLMQVGPGKGVFDLRTFLKLIDQVSRDMPLVIEHLDTAEEYRDASNYILKIAREVNVEA